MKGRILMLSMLCLTLIGCAMPARAESGMVMDGVHLRAGPGTGYPVIASVSYGERVNIHGCLAGRDWCEVDWRGYTGWIAERYVQSGYSPVVYDARPAYRPPVVVFKVDYGRDRHDWDRPYYGPRWGHDRWDHHGPHYGSHRGREDNDHHGHRH